MTQKAKNDTTAVADHPPELYRVQRHADLFDSLDEAMTESGLQQYEDAGFVGVREVLSPQDVRDALDAIDDLISGNVEGFEDVMLEAAAGEDVRDMTLDERRDCVRRVFHFTQHEPRLHRIAHDPKLLRMVGELMGGREPALFQDMALLKPPKIGREKPWHQDNAYFGIDPSEPIVGIWIALDEATVDNGCMQVLEGGHKSGPQLHWKRRDWQICDTDILGKTSVAVPLPPGGGMFFTALLPHGTPTNRSPKRRRALQLHYAPADAVRISNEQRLEIFGTEGKNVTC